MPVKNYICICLVNERETVSSCSLFCS